MLADDLSVQVIAKHINVKPNLLMDYTRRTGMRIPKARILEIEKFRGEIRAMLRDGKKIPDISRTLRLDEKRVYRYAVKQAWHTPKPPVATHIQRIKEMYYQGSTAKQIAHEFGCGAERIRRLLFLFDVLQKRNFVSHHREQVIAYAAKGYSRKWTADKLGLSRDALRIFARRYNIEFSKT